MKISKIIYFVVSTVFVLQWYLPAFAHVAIEKGQVTGLKIPRFVSLKANEVNLRRGPNNKYPIAWVYKRKGYPLELVAEFENWRKLKDIDGSEGWTHESLITGARSAVIKSNHYADANSRYANYKRELMVFRYPDELSYPLLRAEFGVVVKLKKCNQLWCKVKIDSVTGWIEKANLWGIYSDEIIE